MGNYSVIKTFDFEDKKSVDSPIYFVENETEQIVARSDWRCVYTSRTTLPGFNVDLLVDADYDNGDVSQIVCN